MNFINKATNIIKSNLCLFLTFETVVKLLTRQSTRYFIGDLQLFIASDNLFINFTDKKIRTRT